MNFFRSILSEDPDPPIPASPPDSPTNPPPNHSDSDQSPPPLREEETSSSNPNSAADGSGGAWSSFGGLIKNLATRSESVIETYRRDLKEFGSGLQKETAAIREAARSIEVGASVGHAIDGVWKSTAEIISHGKEALLASSDGELEISDSQNYSNQSSSSRKYSRFDAQLSLIQSDESTYCEEPEDLDDYGKWKLGFVLEEKSEEINILVEENGNIGSIYKRVVPNLVDHETFWCRYFYRVHKIKQKENVRANLVKRAISIDIDEELTWDVDDDDVDEDEETNRPLRGDAGMVENKELGSEELPQVMKEEGVIGEAGVGSSEIVDDKGEENKPNLEEGNVIEASSEKVMNKEVSSEQFPEEGTVGLVLKLDEKVGMDGKVDNGGSCKDSDVSIVSTQPSLPEEEDLEWDEIEDLGSNDDKKEIHGGSPSSRADLRKRLSAAEEDEDLNWDIEDDGEEPVSKPDTK